MPKARRFAALLTLLLAAACSGGDPDTAPLPDLGDFRLGHNVVLARETTKGPFSREATPEELTTALGDAIERRLIRYDGDGLYHLGTSIGAYVLAQPGLPIVYTPKSVLIFDVTVYDNATGKKINEEPKRFTVFEGLENTAPIVGSGIARGKEEQLANLVAQGATAVQKWLVENKEWFAPDPEQPRVPFDRAFEEKRLAEAEANARLKSPSPVDKTPAVSKTGPGTPPQ